MPAVLYGVKHLVHDMYHKVCAIVNNDAVLASKIKEMTMATGLNSQGFKKHRQ